MSASVAHDVARLALGAPWGPVGLALGLVAAALAILLTVVGAWRLGGRRRWVLAALRTAGILVALVLFLEPTLVYEDVVRVPNHVAVLVDRSESMRLAETAGAASRAARAAKILSDNKARIAAWRADHKVDFYGFAASLVPTTETALVDAKAPSPRGPATHLREALAALRARYTGGEDLGGVVVVSDGIDNGRFGDELDAEGQDFLKNLGVPVHTVWTGRAGLRDLAVARIKADDFAFARTVVKVEAVLRVAGAHDAGWTGKSIPVTLKQGANTVKTTYVVIRPNAKEITVSFEFTPDRVGKYLYEISTPVLDGDAIPENNARAFVLKVIRDKIRVLQVAGRPSWDERFLRGLLKHDPNVDLISLFILRTRDDVDTVDHDEMSLIPFPTQEVFHDQLRSFDVIFLQDFNWEPYEMAPYLDDVKRFVEEGGGLAMIGGDLSFTSGGWDHTPVADVLPVELLDGSVPRDQLVDLAPFRPTLTPEGRTHPVMALRLGGDNAKRWASLPPLEGANIVARARPGAIVLATHPTVRGLDGRPLPVLAVGDAGKGRALTLLSDSSWRWGFAAAGEPGDDSDDTRGVAYQKFWENAIRWLIRDPELRLLRVESDQSEYRPRERVRLRIVAREPDWKPAAGASVSLDVVRVGNGMTLPIVSKGVKTDADGAAELDLAAVDGDDAPADAPAPAAVLAPGGYRVTARRAVAGGAALQAANLDEEVFVVRGAGRELEDAEARDHLLRAVASVTGASFRTVGDDWGGLSFLPPRVVRTSRHRDRELWSTWLTVALAVMFLGAEWALRRRWGLV